MATITVDFQKTTGHIKALHGVNNGPIGFGGLMDTSHLYREMGVPWVRLHDTNWPHPREVDVPQIFPNFEADPDDPASYCFGPTDDYLRAILATGARIIYRLGVSIEHYERKRYVYPPTNFDKWARIVLGIVRHYSEGWADGIKNAVDYWEIWNEPDLGPKMWSGPFEQYLDLYRCTATTLKQYNPNLKVGGFGATASDNPQVEPFLAYCRQHNLPLDFFSWHCYTNHPDRFLYHTARVREMLVKYGFDSTQSFLDEWNYLPRPWEELFGNDEFMRHDAFESLKNEVGASFAATTLIRMQDAPVDIMNYYDAQPMNWFCGLFDYYGVPQKTFYAFKAFHELLACPERVAVTCDIPELAVLAGCSSDGTSGAVLIGNFGTYEGQLTISLEGTPDHNIQPEILVLDHDHQLEPVPPLDENPIDLLIRPHAVYLMRFPK